MCKIKPEAPIFSYKGGCNSIVSETDQEKLEDCEVAVNEGNDQGFCLKCSSDKYLDEGKCKSPKHSEGIKSEQKKEEDNTSNNCETKSPTGCLKCKEGYYKGRNGSCESCQESVEGCGECVMNDEQVICIKCSDPKYIYDENEKACVEDASVIESCKEPRYDGKKNYCVACENGYYLPDEDENHFICKECIKNCETCNSTTCLKCNSDSYLTPDRQCIKISTVI